MVKVYDMVTYGLCASGEDAPALNFGIVRTERVTVPEADLQLIEIAPAPQQEVLHPSLRCRDVDSFLATFGD